MNISSLKSFLAMAEEKSITAAAEKMYISPVSLREQLNRLEKELGFAVFIRSKKGISLTPAGQALYNGLPSVMNSYTELMTKCRSIAENAAPSICLAMYKPYSVLDLCMEYCKMHPEVTFRYMMSDYSSGVDIRKYMRENGIDLMQECYSPAYEEEGLNFLPFKTEYFSCYYSNERLFPKKTVGYEDLKGKELYISDVVSLECKLLIRDAESRGVAIKTLPYSDDNVLKFCAAGGVWIGETSLKEIFPGLYRASFPEAPQLVHGFVYPDNCSVQAVRFAEFVARTAGEKKARRMHAICSELRRRM